VHIELRHLRYFVAVAEELNFSRAAERLHIAQPALSTQIRSLEKQVGCELFTRTTRKVELTANGEMLLADARDIITRTDGAVAKLQAAARGELGQLRIGYVAHGAGEVSTEILRRFAEAYPSVATELVSAASLEELQRQVRDAETDVAFVWLPLLYEELEARPVMTDAKVVAVNLGHPLAAKKGIRAADLTTEPIVAPWDLFPKAFLDAWFGPIRPDGRKAGDPQAISVDESLTFVSRGLAVYCMPESASRFYSGPDVVFRPIVDSSPVEVAIAWRADSTSPAVASFIESARG
jgi:DNA-binding transcriptional LysR family regulator